MNFIFTQMRLIIRMEHPNLARMTASVACRVVLPPIQAAAGAVALIPKTVNFVNT